MSDLAPEAAGPSSPTTTAAWGWLLAAAVALFLMPDVAARYTPNTWLVGDGGFYLNMQKSLTRYGTLDQTRLHPHSWYSGKTPVDDAFSNVSLGRSEQWWPKHSYLMPIAALPFYWLFGVSGTLLFNMCMMVSMVVLGYHLARSVAPPGIAAAAAFASAVGGPFLLYAYNFSNDGFYTVLLMGALLAITRDRLVLAGVLFGLSIWSKITCVLATPAVLGYLLWRRVSARDVVMFCAAAAGPVAGYALANWYMFGAPWITSYHRVLVVREGITTVASHTDLFTVNFWTGLKQILFWTHRGLVTGYPFALFAWLGFIPMLRSRRLRPLALGLAATMLILIGFYAPFKYYMERFLFPYFGLMIIPAAALLAGLSALSERISIPRRARIAAVVALLTAMAGVSLAMTLQKRSRYVMSEHIEDARVYLGDRHCDYFNNMRWSWECVGRDRGDAEFVGVNAAQVHELDGKPVEGYIFVKGHHTRKQRRLVFVSVPMGDTLRIRYGLDDASKPPFKAELIVYIGVAEVWRGKAVTKGTLFEQSINTSDVSGTEQDVTFVVNSRHRRNSRLVLNGWVE